MTKNHMKSWYFRNLEWERKHPKFMICLRISTVAAALVSIYSMNQTILDLIGLEAAMPILIAFGVGFLLIASLVYLLYRKLKKTWIHEWELANEKRINRADNETMGIH